MPWQTTKTKTTKLSRHLSIRGCGGLSAGIQKMHSSGVGSSWLTALSVTRTIQKIQKSKKASNRLVEPFPCAVMARVAFDASGLWVLVSVGPMSATSGVPLSRSLVSGAVFPRNAGNPQRVWIHARTHSARPIQVDCLCAIPVWEHCRTALISPTRAAYLMVQANNQA